MRRRIVVGAALAGLIIAATFFVLKSAPKKSLAQPQMEVSDANSAACEATAKEECNGGSCRVIVVQLLPSTQGDIPVVRINEQNATWKETETILLEVLRTRMNKAAFLTSDPKVTPGYKPRMIDLMRRANAGEICVIDSKSPPKWYLPRYARGGGFGGDGLLANRW